MMHRRSRRLFCRAGLGGILVSTSIFKFVCAKAVRAQTAVENPSAGALPERTPDDWMLEWQKNSLKNKEIKNPLDVRRFKDPIYVLLGPLEWNPNTQSPLAPVKVPRGFVTDFASVPRVFWSLFRPDGDYAYAAVVHDYLYWQQDRPKSDADLIFRSVMDDLKITDRQSAILYHAVDLFGGAAWRENARLKASGEKRILSELPSSSDVTWEEWKSRPNVFSNS
ncbi:DUF1353 domain-containing protein [Paraburkholderia sp. JPY419]|uniref:DUF1353 domain-containing protein n=1 Tax=Paraburkholderia sp. JPY419 TaxID=667660 RepID=UPI003D23F2AB